ncbi:histidine phosphatase family protein [Actinoplanes sp. TBRC 11911]|uniref:histidine phosphatase family protein n=1 Tax=Actinoplanes sp. TBRC 11911 TaxID=2729386 RepID=UPI00145D9F86|nr:histidine phosphatase family protein [Actinoplanes sp. TBRC 11911]NMO52752.1 histidine phosphatase family protein [Actinoplanes sp. TBRC 11911]
MNGLRLVAAGPTRSLRRALFGGDDPLDEAGRNTARTMQIAGPWVCAPSRAAQQTVLELGGTNALLEPALSDPDYGTWTGRTLSDVDATTWLTDPDAAPHGGESLSAVRARAGAWLDHHTDTTLTAVAHTTIVRALLAYALRTPPDGIWSLEVAPLSVSHLTYRAGRWHLSIT